MKSTDQVAKICSQDLNFPNFVAISNDTSFTPSKCSSGNLDCNCFGNSLVKPVQRKELKLLGRKDSFQWGIK